MRHFPANYKPILTLRETEKAVKLVKDIFERELSGSLQLSRVTSPKFVPSGCGLNDDLNGIERPVRFPIGNMNNKQMEVVQSLAKWKRMALADYQMDSGYGLYTDMDALRPDDDIDCIHSIYVDQWDWERVIAEEDRNVDFLIKVVKEIYAALRRTEFLLHETYSSLKPILPEEITFIHSLEAEEMYPELSPVERESELAKKYGAVFIIGIGSLLKGGIPHSGRAPDYDDWTSVGYKGLAGLNGDIIVWDEVRSAPLELSSMGIRVSPEVLLRQLKIKNVEERKDLYWHKRLLNNEFPQTIGGGIGQSRMCLFLLKKAHLGEVQSSIWSDDTYKEAKELGLKLL